MAPRRVLEVGCGTGRNLAALAKAFPEAEIVGLDLSEEMLRIAREKTAAFGERVRLLQGAYLEPVAEGELFDLIVFSYYLSMINPGYTEALAICERDLSDSGRIAIVDFHDTRCGWFRQWMGMNHVRFDGQILRAIAEQGLQVEERTLQPAYGGLWRWLLCVAARPAGETIYGVRI
jgi:S-adenosylmethionine-diacylgycerolhomoserine-N-methlytransferase